MGSAVFFVGFRQVRLRSTRPAKFIGVMCTQRLYAGSPTRDPTVPALAIIRKKDVRFLHMRLRRDAAATALLRRTRRCRGRPAATEGTPAASTCRFVISLFECVACSHLSSVSSPAHGLSWSFLMHITSALMELFRFQHIYSLRS